MPIEGLGARLADVIATERLSQNEFASRLEMSGSFVSDVVRGAKLPGAEFLSQLKSRFGVSVDWLLSGEGSMYGGQPIDLEELRRLAALVDLARKAEVEHSESARSLVKTIQSLQAPADAELDLWAKISSESSDAAPDRLLAAALYNSHLWTPDRWQRYRNALSTAIAHFQLNRPLEIASRAAAKGDSSASSGPVQNNTGPNLKATMFGSFVGAKPAEPRGRRPSTRTRRRP
jgi:transcriptional regulator with XRE-family HTH domain